MSIITSIQELHPKNVVRIGINSIIDLDHILGTHKFFHGKPKYLKDYRGEDLYWCDRQDCHVKLRVVVEKGFFTRKPTGRIKIQFEDPIFNIYQPEVYIAYMSSTTKAILEEDFTRNIEGYYNLKCNGRDRK